MPPSPEPIDLALQHKKKSCVIIINAENKVIIYSRGGSCGAAKEKRKNRKRCFCCL